MKRQRLLIALCVTSSASAAAPGKGDITLRASCFMHTCRERNFGFVAGVQSIAQLRSRYGKDSESLLAGFQSHVVLGRGLDLESAEYFSRMSGKATLAIPTNLEAAVAGAAWHMISRNLLLPGDIQVNRSNPHWGTPATLFLANGINPFQCYLTPAHQNGSIYRTMQSVERSSCSESLRS